MTAAGAFSAGLTGLTPATTYHFRAVAVGDGTDYGADQTFTTASLPDEPPEVTTAAATGIATTSATLNLTLTGLGTAASVQVSFEWGPTTGYGYTTPAQSLDGDRVPELCLSGLAPETTYHFRARAVGDGTDYGVDQTFTTAALPDEPPEVTTRAASAIGSTSATLNLNLAGLGSASSVQGLLRVGPDHRLRQHHHAADREPDRLLQLRPQRPGAGDHLSLPGGGRGRRHRLWR